MFRIIHQEENAVHDTVIVRNNLSYRTKDNGVPKEKQLTYGGIDMDKPLVSIIIPIYNGEKYLEKAVEVAKGTRFAPVLTKEYEFFLKSRREVETLIDRRHCGCRVFKAGSDRNGSAFIGLS